MNLCANTSHMQFSSPFVAQYCLCHHNPDQCGHYLLYPRVFVSLHHFIAVLRGHSYVLCLYLSVQTHWPTYV